MDYGLHGLFQNISVPAAGANPDSSDNHSPPHNNDASPAQSSARSDQCTLPEGSSARSDQCTLPEGSSARSDQCTLPEGSSARTSFQYLEITCQAQASFTTNSDKSLSQATYDIGNIVNATMDPDDVQKLSHGEKYALLKHNKDPPDWFSFPATYEGGHNRTFKRSWLREYPWMVYSIALDGAFCIACVLFCTNRGGKGQFVNCPFTEWHKKCEKCKEHNITERQCNWQTSLFVITDTPRKMSQMTSFKYSTKQDHTENSCRFCPILF